MTANILPTLLVLAFALVPGAALAARFMRDSEDGLWTWAIVAPTISLALVALLSLVAHVVPMTLTTAVYAWLVLAVAATVPFLGDLREVLRLRAPIGDTLVILGATAASFVGGPWLKLDVDTFYHLAAARSLLVENAVIVTDPFYGSGAATPDPSSGLVHTFMAIMCRIKDADPLYLIWGVNVLGTFMVVAGMVALARAIMRKRPGAWLVALAYVVLVLYADFRPMSYPSYLALGIAFLGLGALTEFLRSRSRRAAVLLALCSFTVVAHLGSTQGFVAIGAALALGWVLTDGSRPARQRLTTAVLALSIVAIAAAPLALPRVLALTSQTAHVAGMSAEEDAAEARPQIAGVLDVPGGAIVDPAAFFDSGSVVFLGALVVALGVLVVGLRERDGVMGATGAAALSVGVVSLVPPLTGLLLDLAPYVLVRLLGSIRFALVLPLAALLVYEGPHRPRLALRTLGAAWVVVALVAAAPYVYTVYGPRPATSALRPGQANQSIWHSHKTSVLARIDQKALGTVRLVIGDTYPMVAATEDVGYMLAGLLPVRIVAASDGHSPVSVEVRDGALRREQMARFFTEGTPLDERRAIAERWDTDFALVWIVSPEDELVAQDIDRQRTLFAPVVDAPRLKFWWIKRPGPSGWPGDFTIPPQGR